jgi:hypothetical protein
MTARGQSLFPGFTSSHLKCLGELLICATRLQKAIESPGAQSAAWRERADELVDEALRIADAAAASQRGAAVRVSLRDGTAVIADLDYLGGLVRKMHRHHSLGVLQAALAEGQLVAS